MGSRLFHVSDIHFGREDPAALAWFAGIVHAERPDALIVTGDYTFRARSSEFAAAAAWLESLDVPMTLEPGNHDLPYYNPFKRFFTPYRRFLAVERRIEHQLDLPDVAIVPLRTVSRFQWRWNQSRGIVRAAHLDTAVAELAAVPPGKLRLVAVHHPLVDVAEFSRPQGTRGGGRALQALAEAGADAVLSGHVHDPFDRIWPGPPPVRLIGAGTLSARVRHSPPSFNALEVEAGSLRVVRREMR